LNFKTLLLKLKQYDDIPIDKISSINTSFNFLLYHYRGQIVANGRVYHSCMKNQQTKSNLLAMHCLDEEPPKHNHSSTTRRGRGRGRGVWSNRSIR